MATTVDPPSIKPQLDANAEKIKQRIQKALDAATERLSENTLREGRQDISGAGNFGTRWTEGFTSSIEGSGETRTLTFRQAVPYWRIFQYGGLIRAKNPSGRLWIPLPGVDRNERGDFFQTSKKGNLLLFKKEGSGIRPLRVGKESVRIPKKFHLIETVKAQAKTFGSLYKAEFVKAK